jgi:Protein of unknown function (DUF1573)/Beta-propeller repeat
MRIFARLVLLFALHFVSFVAAFAAVSAPDTVTKTVSIPLTFERNEGQVSRQYGFVSRHGSLEALFSPKGVDLIIPERGHRARRLEMRPCFPAATIGIEPEQRLTGFANYLRGPHAEHWITRVSTFGQLRYTSLYPGVDLLFHGDRSGAQLENDFVVAPGTDPHAISFVIRGADKVRLRSDGDLAIEVDSRLLLLHRPIAYQQTRIGRASIAAGFRLSAKDVVSFHVGRYDHKNTLTIDPVLSFATYLDGSAYEQISALAIDGNGNVYAAGSTSSTDFPVANAEQVNAAGDGDAFLAKLDPTGHTLIYSTYFGGSNTDEAESIAVDANGNVAISGTTSSTDFPLKGSLPATSPGNFIASLDSTGATLRYSGFLGALSPVQEGSYLRLNRVAFDSQGNAYVNGKTNDPKFLLTAGAYGAPIAPYPAEDTLFIAKVNVDGSLGYAATIPETPAQQVGSNVRSIDPGNIAVDSAGEVVLGGTAGPDLPTTTGTLSPTFPNSALPASGSAGFALKLNASGSALVFSTYLPGTSQVNDVSLDASNNIYLAGSTYDSTLPTSANAFQKTLIPRDPTGESIAAGFVFKLNSSGTVATGASYFGGATAQGSGATAIQGIVVDANGNVDIAGGTGAADLPLKNPLLSIPNSRFLSSEDTDLFVAQFSADLSTLQFGSFLSAPDDGAQFQALAASPSGQLILSGLTFSYIFPTTPGSFQGSPPPQQNPLVGIARNFIAGINLAVPAPSLCFDTAAVNFGFVLVHTVAPATMNINNCGNAALTLASVTSSDPTVTATQNCSGIAPGSSCQLQLAYAPTSAGNLSGTVTLSGNAAISAQGVSVTGIGGAPQVSLPPSIEFGDLLVGQTGAINGLALLNYGTGAFILTSASVTGDFQITQNTCNASVPVGSFCQIQINFSPTAIGTRTGVLTLTDNLTPTVQTIALSGNGLTSAPAPATGIIPAIPLDATLSSALTVHGAGFFPNSTILWNGSPRKTYYEGEGMLAADLSAADLQQVGEAQVTVTTPSPGGGTSAPGTATIYGRLKNIQILNEVFEPHSQLIYATVAKTSPTNANSVVAIDPVLMRVTKTVLTGNGPNTIAVSDDGALLYVGLDDLLSVTQVSLPDGTQNFTLQLPAVTMLVNEVYPDIVASGLKVVPGHPHTWLVGLCESTGEPCGLGVAVFDDAIMRPTEELYSQLTANNFVFVNDPTVVYSTEFNQLPSDISAYQITADGITRTAISAFLPAVGGSILESDGSLIYDSSGQAIDPSTLTTKVTYPQANGAFALDSANQRLYFVGPPPFSYGYTYPGSLLLSAVSQTTTSTLGQIVFSEEGNVSTMERFGVNGLAVNQGNQWLFLKTSLTTTTIPFVTTTVTPSSLSFGMQTEGTSSAAQQVTLTNLGTAPLAISSISATGDFAESNDCGASLEIATPCVIQVSFTPTAAGYRRGQLTIVDNWSSGAQTVSLDGTGAAAAPVVSLSISAQSLKFGTQTQGTTSATQQVTVKNTGTAAFTLAGISTTGDYAQTNNCGASLAISTSCVISVSFTPTATGDRGGQLTISDSAPGSPQTVSLDGTGVAAAAPITLGAQSAGGESATVASGSPATYQLTLSTAQYSGVVAFSCSGAPTNATCTISPASSSVTAGKPTSITVTVTTAASSQSALLGGRGVIRAGLGWISLLSLAGITFLRRRWNHIVAVSVFSFFFTIMIIGCGGGGSSAGMGSPTGSVTPGTYQLTITASANSQKATEVLTLTVK